MSDLVVRRATPSDAEALAALIDGFATKHPAALHPRSMNNLRSAFFGSQPVGHVLLAEKNGTVIGFSAWRKTYDVFWSMFGGDGIGLYVEPAHRGRGVAACIGAAICAEIRDAGGHFLQASYGPELASFYERVGIGSAERTCHISAAAFEALAATAGSSARTIMRGLPDKSLNYTSEIP